MSVVRFFVSGLPATAGSKRGFPVRRKNGTIGVAMVADCKRAKPWMASVACVAAEHVETPIDGPVTLSLTFHLPRPKSHYGAKGLKATAMMKHTKAPDLTKLVRCVEDALKGIAWFDDSQVWRQHTAKIYGEKVGVDVEIEAGGNS